MEALEYMIENNWFENDIVRIGAEQEIVLIDKKNFKPSVLSPQILEENADKEWLVSELARFNLELNLNPQVFTGPCFKNMQQELENDLTELRKSLHNHGIDYLLTGILPTLRKYHLHLSNLTPKKRYEDLMQALHGELRGNSFELRLTGIDELLVRHDSPLLEACNTSFQVHLQVAPDNFVDYYNCALALTAPSIAIAANSPIVFGKRLWHETRIALFQQAIDTRKVLDHMRQMSPRVILGDRWLQRSVTEIFKDDIARFRVLLHAVSEEDSMASVKNKIVPKLKSLQLHNSTVYRWNRPCYGISDTGKPHLRIENRIFPSGPTILDEMANTAYWLGAMIGLKENFGDVTKHMSFEDVRDNFGKSARFGIDSNFTWFNDVKINASDLTLQVLLPLAREGLEKMEIDRDDINKYLEVIEGRAKKHMNGARWILRSYTSLMKETSNSDEALTTLTASIYDNQNSENNPIHQWKECTVDDLKEYRPQALRVSDFMETDFYTVHKTDLVELVAKLMNWKRLKYMAVEDRRGNLVGLISQTQIINHLIDQEKSDKKGDLLVKDILISDPITVNPDENIRSAMILLKKNEIGCLPVVRKKELVGMLTKDNFLKITDRLI